MCSTCSVFLPLYPTHARMTRPPCLKWRDQEAWGWPVLSRFCASLGSSWWVVWELWYGCVHGMFIPCCGMKFWCLFARCARLQHLLLSLWLYFVPNLSIFTLWIWSLSKSYHLLVPAKLTIQERREKLGKWEPGSYGVFSVPLSLYKSLARASQGSAYWLLGCLLRVIGIVRVLCLVSLRNFLFQLLSFLLWGFSFSVS